MRRYLICFLAIPALLASHFAFADKSPAENHIEQSFDSFLTKARTSDGTKIIKDALIQVDDTNQGKIDHKFVRPTRGVTLMVNQPFFSVKQDWVINPLNEVFAPMYGECAASGGSMIVEQSFRTNFSYRLGETLAKDNLIGRFKCINNESKNTMFLLESSITLYTKPTWYIEIAYLNSNEFAAAEKSIAENHVAIDEFRKSLSPGQQISIPALDVPSSNIPKYDEDILAKSKLMVCAMVVEVKPNIIQLQNGSGTFYLPPDKILPFTKKHEDGTGFSMDYKTWCL